jgi:hypothetical protein
VQNIKEFIWPKGQMMSAHKTGLHKSVSVIFDGVWNPDVDNIQESFNEPVANTAAYVQQWPMAVDNWPKEDRFANIVKALVKAPGYIFSSRRRREKKRLLTISKHLLINIPS